MNPKRKLWNQQHEALRRALGTPADHPQAIELFLHLHAMVHSAEMSHAGVWSFEDEILQDMIEEDIRRIPRNCEHSIAWILWHIARIEDVTMNLLVAGSRQILDQSNWLEKMKITRPDTGNIMDVRGVDEVSTTIDVQALRAYRLAVGRRTREVVIRLRPEDIQQQVEPSRLQRVSAQGAVVAAASDLLDYWSKRTIGGLLLMPPTRHNFVHLNEALRIKQK